MTIQDVISHFTYNEWANARVFGAIETLTPEQLTKDLGSSFPTILHTAAHIVGGEWIWLRRWIGDAPAAMPDWATAPALTDIRERLARIETERRAFLSTLNDHQLNEPRTFTLFNGKADTQPLVVQCMHVVNHASYHRGQVATMFRQIGLKPVSTDLIAFARQRT